MKNKRLTATDIDNVLTEQFLFKRFQLLALNMFEWSGLDELNIQERHLENYLFDEGKCAFFEDKAYGLLCLPCQGIGANIYNDPVGYRMTGFNYSVVRKASDVVLVENNKLRMPTAEIVRYFTRQLYEVVRSRDVNIKTLKLPFIIACDDNTQFTLKRVVEKIDDNEFAIFGDKNVMDLEKMIQVLQTGVKPLTAELTDQYHDILNEALTYLGINNANTDKKERLITDEANANNQFIESCCQMFLEARERACEEINKRFGTNISVKLRGGMQNAVELLQKSITGNEQPNNA